MNLKERIIEKAKQLGADAVGFASIDRFEKDDPVHKIMPETRTVICLSFRLLRGMYRGIEEGTTYYQYTTMAFMTMEETVMPRCRLGVANLIEEEGYIALPQRMHPTIRKKGEGTNPETDFHVIHEPEREEPAMNFTDAAVRCGIGEKGLHGALLTDKSGPLVRVCFVLTDAVIEEDPVKPPHLCDGCGACVNACPGHAIDSTGHIDEWQCAAYYRGASGIKNPFMQPTAYAEFDDRLDIISGRARLTPERAREVIDATIFYPPAKLEYPSSICGRACDMACYMHLEEKGLLTGVYHDKFRKREEWHYSLDDYR